MTLVKNVYFVQKKKLTKHKTTSEMLRVFLFCFAHDC